MFVQQKNKFMLGNLNPTKLRLSSRYYYDNWKKISSCRVVADRKLEINRGQVREDGKRRRRDMVHLQADSADFCD